MNVAKKRYEMRRIPYPLGYVEKILDNTLRKFEKKLGGFDPCIVFKTRTEEIGKRVSQIQSERHVIPINKELDDKEIHPVTYYRSFPIQEIEKEDLYCPEIFKEFLPYRMNSTIEHIGIKQKNADLEMVVTFAGRSEFCNCQPYVRGYISERSYSKPNKSLTYKDILELKTREFFVDAFNNYFFTNNDYYFNTHLKYKDVSRDFFMTPFLHLHNNRFWDDAILIHSSSNLFNNLCRERKKISGDKKKEFRTDEFIEMIVGHVEKNNHTKS